MKAIDRFYEYLAEKSLKPTAIEKEIGLSNGYLSAQKKRNADMGEGMILKIIDNFRDINPLWLLTGEGSMLRNETLPITINAPSSKSISSFSNDDFVSISLVDISVAAGCSGCDNPDYLEVVDTIKMPSSMVHNSEKYFCVRSKGESMSPTLLDSSYVIVRLLDRSEWQDMPDQHIYVISDTDGRSYIKRIKNRFRQHGFLVCMSDNVDKINYPNFNLEAQEINTILHAEWYFSAKMPNLNETYYDKVNQLEDDMDVMKGQMVQIQQLLRAINVK